jgi:hypothetical protein
MVKSTNVATTQSFKSLYLLLTIVGSIIPWFFLLQDPTSLLSPSLVLQRAVANNVATAVTADFLISSLVFLCFVWIELKRLGASWLWLLLYTALTFIIGLSCSLPLFLYRREQMLESNV